MPQDALVIDDSATAADWATQAGARAVLISPTEHPASSSTNPTLRLGSLSELMVLIERLG